MNEVALLQSAELAGQDKQNTRSGPAPRLCMPSQLQSCETEVGMHGEVI